MNDHAPPLRGKAGWTMEDAIRYTEVQYLNLNYLLTIQVGLKHDPLATCCTYHLDTASAETLAAMSVDSLQLLAASMSHESLFKPIANFKTLLETPPVLAMTLCRVGAVDQDAARGPSRAGQATAARARLP